MLSKLCDVDAVKQGPFHGRENLAIVPKNDGRSTLQAVGYGEQCAL